MQLQVLNSPFTEKQADVLNEILPTLSKEQQIWLSGYLTGYQSTSVKEIVKEKKKTMEVTVLYGSQTGNSQSLAEQFSDTLSERGIKVQLTAMNEFKPNQLKKLTHVLIIVSTQGEGDPPDNAIGFHEFLYSKRAPKLSHLHYSVLALGDRSYDLFCYTGKQFDERLQELGANRISPRVDCDLDYDEPALDWFNRVLDEINIDKADSSEVLSTPVGKAGTSVFTKNNPFYAEVYENINLNGRGSQKETRHLELSLEGSNLTFEPGDSIGIYPQNDRQLVEAIVKQLELSDSIEVTIDKEGNKKTLVDALINHFEVTVLTKHLLTQLAHFTTDESYLQLLQSEDQKIKDFIYGRDLLDVFTHFGKWNVNAEQLIQVLRKLPARLYSIASSYEANPDEVHLTIGKVQYESNHRVRNGVCSVQIAEKIEPGDTLPIYVHKNPNFRLPENPSTPIIMIGPGTGIAPFRSFIEHREAIDADGKSWLFFGDQHYVTDFLYQTDLQGWLKRGVLTNLDVAFSRDQEEKDYVQHHLMKHAKELYEWIETGAYIYICGDEKRMAKDVHDTLVTIIEQEGNRTNHEAHDYLKYLQQEKRYQRDVY